MTPQATTAEHLAECLGVCRRRIYKWRKEGAPADLSWSDWHAWLVANGRTTIANRIANRLPEPAPTAEAPAGPILGTSPADGSASTPAGETPDKRHWDAIRSREQAIAARRERERLEGTLVESSAVKQAFATVGALVVELLTDSIWLEMRPLLGASTPDLVRNLRAAHDRAIAGIRLRLRDEVGQRLSRLQSPEPRP
jgi:hypothetical protein